MTGAPDASPIPMSLKYSQTIISAALDKKRVMNAETLKLRVLDEAVFLRSSGSNGEVDQGDGDEDDVDDDDYSPQKLSRKSWFPVRPWFLVNGSSEREIRGYLPQEVNNTNADQ